jgi:hypothetical protein
MERFIGRTVLHMNVLVEPNAGSRMAFFIGKTAQQSINMMEGKSGGSKENWLPHIICRAMLGSLKQDGGL